jgi:hypothetical protein
MELPELYRTVGRRQVIMRSFARSVIGCPQLIDLCRLPIRSDLRYVGRVSGMSCWIEIRLQVAPRVLSDTVRARATVRRQAAVKRP